MYQRLDKIIITVYRKGFGPGVNWDKRSKRLLSRKINFDRVPINSVCPNPPGERCDLILCLAESRDKGTYPEILPNDAGLQNREKAWECHGPARISGFCPSPARAKRRSFYGPVDASTCGRTKGTRPLETRVDRHQSSPRLIHDGTFYL